MGLNHSGPCIEDLFHLRLFIKLWLRTSLPRVNTPFNHLLVSFFVPADTTLMSGEMAQSVRCLPPELGVCGSDL